MKRCFCGFFFPFLKAYAWSGLRWFSSVVRALFWPFSAFRGGDGINPRGRYQGLRRDRLHLFDGGGAPQNA